MRHATLRLYGELNDFLPREHQRMSFHQTFEVSGSVKDLIQAQGVPHTEIDLILVNGRSVGFDYVVRDGDRIAVYPVFASLDISSLVRLRPEPLRDPRFVLDVHLGRLATYLRILGIDASFDVGRDDAELAALSRAQQRILLTRDRGLLMRRVVDRGYYVRATDPPAQIVEIVRRFDLTSSFDPLSRCTRCNTRLHPIPKDQVVDRLLPRTRETYDTYSLCDTCERVYWQGSHYARMLAFVEWVRQEAESAMDAM